MSNQIYNSYQRQSAAFRETNDCAVIAIASATEHPYADVHAALKRAGRKNRQGTYQHQQLAAMKQLGVTHTTLPRAWGANGYYGWELGAGVEITSKTVNKLEAELQKKAYGRRFLIYVSRHVLAFNGHEITDWTKGRNHRIRAIMEITNGPDCTVLPTSIKQRVKVGSRVVVLVNGRKQGTYKSVAEAYRQLGDTLLPNFNQHKKVRKLVKENGQHKWTERSTDRLLREITIKVA